MGQEVRCSVSHAGKSSEGRALLETHELVFRGDADGDSKGLRLRIPHKAIESVASEDGRLHVSWEDGAAVFNLGEHAEKWAEKIRNPKSLLDKLGVKAGMAVTVIGVGDVAFLADLEAHANVCLGEPLTDQDMIFYGVDAADDMLRLRWLRDNIKRTGGVWVVFRKGGRDFNENDVLRLGLESGMVDVKVVRFSETHTASKFVIRKDDR